ncbi:MAG: hypothetical protein ABR527_11565 [Gemmatimonadota bacterium]
MITRAFLLTIVFITTTCDVGTEFEIDEGDPVDLTGTWSYRAELFGDLVTCQINGLTLHIQQEGITLTGSTEGGTAECIFPDQLVRQPLEPMALRDGELIGRSQFRMSFGEGQRWRHAGDIVLPTFMRGTTDMTRDFGGEIGVVELTSGEWSADRQ